MSIPLAVTGLTTRSSNLKSLIDGHLEDTGGIDERWFGSTTETANEGRAADEGLSYVVVGNERFTLRDAIAKSGAAIIGKTLWDKYGNWPVYSKFGPEVDPDASAIVAYKN